MDSILLSNIPFQPDSAALMQKLHIKAGSDYAQDFLHILVEAQSCARPKALYRQAYIYQKGDNWVTIEGQRFTSRVLRVNLETAQRVFAYTATCGSELEEWSHSIHDLLYSFWADAIKEAALRAAIQALSSHLDRQYEVPRTANMNPGSLADWPIEQQEPLFKLLGDTQATAGVTLTESFLMSPIKSVSGLRFPLEESFESCQLCQRQDCPNRRAPYDADLYKRKYAKLDTGD